ncbi:GNAT family N-acetyltransferase [Actinoallomurus sp. CA-142502]|uniref:GNAT family N-acetyltransferase n=1 Tax=Actinoallomurus sp. CA-142502 TaxID=3239885 RepID=UPI003D948F4A
MTILDVESSAEGQKTVPQIRHLKSGDTELLRDVVALADRCSKTLGFLTPPVFEQAADQGTLAVALIEGRLAGYTLYSLPRQVVRLKHLCVAPEFRGHGLASALVSEISERRKDRFGIVLRCRSDYKENAIWPHLGFERMGEIPGRSKKRLPLTVWRLDHGHPDLFSATDSTAVLKVAIDLNVFLDLEVRLSQAGLATSQVLNQDWLAGQLELVVTSELLHEIDRLPDGQSKEHQSKIARRYPVVQGRAETVHELSQQITDHVKSHHGVDLSLSHSDKSDVRHVAQASAAGISVFATRDERLLSWAATAVDVCGVRALHPSDVILHVDELTRTQAYQPAELQRTEYKLTRTRAGSEGLLTTFLQSESGERRADFLKRVRQFSVEAQQWDRLLLQDPSGSSIAFYITGNRKPELSVPIFRVRSSKIDDTVARQTLFVMRQHARSLKVPIIRITDQYLSKPVSTAIQDEGFIRHDDSWIGLCIDRCADAAAVEQLTTSVADSIDLRLPALRPRLSPVVAAGLERALWPAKILDSELPTFVVPIRPEWSAELFDVPQTLTPRPNRLGISREHVYYRSARRQIEHAPARLLWYVTETGNGGLGAIIACSRLEEVVIDGPATLYARFRHLGVWRRHDIQQSAHQGKALALRFVDTELFPRHIPLGRFRRMADRIGHRLVLRSPQKIPSELFEAVYQEGWNQR